MSESWGFLLFRLLWGAHLSHLGSLLNADNSSFDFVPLIEGSC